MKLGDTAKVLLLPEPVPGAEPGWYALLHQELGGGVAMLSLLGEDPQGCLCRTGVYAFVGASELRHFRTTGVEVERR